MADEINVEINVEAVKESLMGEIKTVFETMYKMGSIDEVTKASERGFAALEKLTALEDDPNVRMGFACIATDLARATWVTGVKILIKQVKAERGERKEESDDTI